MDDPEIEDAFESDIVDLDRFTTGGNRTDAAIYQNPTDTVRQPFQDVAIQGIGTAEAMDDFGFRALFGLVPHVLAVHA